MLTPSGRKVKNEFESDGDLLTVTSAKAGSQVFAPYASNFSYTASGGISQMKLGNGKWETAKFNTRLQLTELGLGSGPADASTWKVNYDYGELNTDGTVNATKNTGNIAKQTLSFSGLANPFVQSYKYDSLYRLTEAKETANGQQNWIQNWSYDRYGNRLSFSQNIGGIANNSTPTVDPNTNRFVIGQGFGYDKNGNVVADIAQENQPRTFVFNGDNKQTEVKKDGVTIGHYYYDGEGKRVKKVTDTETTVFVYSAGKLIAEYSTQISQTPQTKYLTEDHLGTPRIITNELGEVVARRDFLPFGEELFNGVGARAENLKYGTNASDVKQKFTGYLKDSETGLDFAEARMYENRYGRFTAVDPLMSSGRSDIPQTWNRYVYCLNNPIVCTDPTGMDGGIWAMQYRGGGVELKYFESEEALNAANAMDATDFCKVNQCSSWTRYTREYFLWDDQSVSRLGSDGVRTDFSVATIGEQHWNNLVAGFYSENGFNDEQKLMLQVLYERKLDQDRFDEVVGLKDNPKHLETGSKNPLAIAKQIVRKFTVGDYGQLKKAAAGSTLDAHHVGQRALMKQFVPNYDPETAPAILVPRFGHTRGEGVVSRTTAGFTNARQVLARDIMELRRVYPDILNTELRQLIHLNRTMYPNAFFKPPK